MSKWILKVKLQYFEKEEVFLYHLLYVHSDTYPVCNSGVRISEVLLYCQY